MTRVDIKINIMLLALTALTFSLLGVMSLGSSGSQISKLTANEIETFPIEIRLGHKKHSDQFSINSEASRL